MPIRMYSPTSISTWPIYEPATAGSRISTSNAMPAHIRRVRFGSGGPRCATIRRCAARNTTLRPEAMTNSSSRPAQLSPSQV